jgi:hypothetical protein
MKEKTEESEERARIMLQIGCFKLAMEIQRRKVKK